MLYYKYGRLSEGTSSMYLLKHPYIKFRREIDHFNFEIKKYEETCYVQLHDDKIVTEEDELEIHKVFDVSYRMMSNQYGFFYLHTVKGVITLHIKEEPIKFIETFRKYEQK